MNLLIAAMALATQPVGQSAGTKILYAPGRKLADQEISLRSWGSGLITESTEAAFEGSTSIRVSSRNFFQGGTVVFGNPVELAGLAGDKNNMLRVTFQSLDGAVGGGSLGGNRTGGLGGGSMSADGGGAAAGAFGAASGGGGRQGGFGPGGPGGGGFGPGGPGPGGPGGGFGQGKGPGGMTGSSGPMGGGASAAAKTLRNIRIIITTTDGKKSEAYMPAATSASLERGWRQAGIPLQAIRGFDKTNKVVKEVSFAGDAPAAFFVGDVRVINDATPLRVEPNVRSLNLALNDSFTFTANGSGGSSVLKYTWDFDDTDGIQVDAEGQTVTAKFRKASWSAANPTGTFTVTLTVSDEYGLKTPYSTKIKVRVNP